MGIAAALLLFMFIVNEIERRNTRRKVILLAQATDTILKETLDLWEGCLNSPEPDQMGRIALANMRALTKLRLSRGEQKQ